MNRVVHFDIPAERPERAVKFYSEVFSWEIKKWEGPMDYWMVTTGPADKPGIDGGIAKKDERNPHVMDSISVPSVDGFLKKVVKNGGRIVAPKMAIPGVGYHALFSDTEGNVFGLLEEDKGAK